MDWLARHLRQIDGNGAVRVYAFSIDGLGTLFSDVRNGDGSELLRGRVPACRNGTSVHGVRVRLVVGLEVLVLLGSVLVSAFVSRLLLTVAVVVVVAVLG